MKSGFALFKAQFQRELLIHWRQKRNLINSCLFFLMLLIFFPLTMRPELAILQTMAPGLIYMAMLLALLISAERLFAQDYEQGVIEQWLVSGQNPATMVFAKVLAHWLFNLIPIIFLCPLFALLYSFNLWETEVLILSLLCSSPALIFLSALASAFGIGIRQRGVLLALILLPLTLPVLIFGAGTLTMALQGFPIDAYLALLLAISLLAMTFLPYAIAGVIRISHAD